MKPPAVRLPRISPRLAAWGGLTIAVAIVAFLAGQQLRPQNPDDFVFDYGAAAYDAPDASVGLSLGGFSGFGSVGDTNGYVVVSGKAVEVSSTSLVLETTWGARTTVRLTAAPSLQRIDAAAASDFRPGDRVMVRVAPDGETAEAILKLP